MSLFPAYSQENVVENNTIVKQDNSTECKCVAMSTEMETELLASDTDEEDNSAAVLSVQSSIGQSTTSNNEFFVDKKLDMGNLRVSTLYYPGRPEYIAAPMHAALGLASKKRGERRRMRRYYESGAEGGAGVGGAAASELAARTAAYQRLLADAPQDEDLWIQFIDFQEWWSGEGAALAAAEAGAARLPRSSRLRARRHRALRLALPADRYLARLRDEIAAERSSGVRTELWVRLLSALAGAAGVCGAAALAAAAAAALRDTRHHAPAYPHILYAYGSFLRSAGLWEQLVLMIELIAAMNYPPASFPPSADVERRKSSERRLRDYEDKAIASGLPLSGVWPRVERARAAAHWRPAPHADLAADPQRAPVPADVADLLQPVVDCNLAFLLSVHMLRLAKVPPLPGAGYVLRGVAGASACEAAAWEAGGGEALLPLVLAARRLPRGHPARPDRPQLARRLLAHFVDPPHYFSDDDGYLSWVTSLWDACCDWASGERRVALLCWRLRWLHSLLLLVDVEEEEGRAEARRVRAEAREALRPPPTSWRARRLTRCCAPH